MPKLLILWIAAFACASGLSSLSAAEPTEPLVFEGKEGPGKGKQIVFLAGDHEYRSEEMLPALARLLAHHHGFKCTVLFTLDKENESIIPAATTCLIPR